MVSESQRRAMRKWRFTHKEQIKNYDKKRDPVKRKEQNKKSHLKKVERDKKNILKIFPLKCSICEVEEPQVRYHLHQIHGEKHDVSKTYKLATEHPENFIRLCYACHCRIHWLMKNKEKIDLIISKWITV